MIYDSKLHNLAFQLVEVFPTDGTNDISSFGHLHLRPVIYETASPNDFSLFLPGPDAEVGGLYLADLRIGCQVLGSSLARMNDFEVVYTPHEVDQYTAKKMAETLNKISKRLTKKIDDQGNCASFTEFAMRVRDVTGIEHLLVDSRWPNADGLTRASVRKAVSGGHPDRWKVVTKGFDIRHVLETREVDVIELTQQGPHKVHAAPVVAEAAE